MPSRYETGLAMRRRVLGPEYVDRALATTDEGMRTVQTLVTEYAWGGIWSRPGLDLRTRSLITLGMLCALDNPGELRLHVGAAIRNGCTTEEIREALLQSMIYLGVPAALAALGIANEELAKAG
ncbi:MAG TPA: carboxymuconolactone decarboxylase family protein [Candidatus Limnocylindrales bacterium]|jgi:4-carboxymuconolactone decarboxylase|nr:carboxymuconolactone decarboxylase family protein [Candidatus Limnocylindrales bacterium]